MTHPTAVPDAWLAARFSLHLRTRVFGQCALVPGAVPRDLPGRRHIARLAILTMCHPPGLTVGAPRRRHAFGSLFVVKPGQPSGQPFHRILQAGIQIDELAQPFGKPAEANLLVAAPLRKFLDTAVREVHGQTAAPAPGAKEASMSARCSAACMVAEPTAGAELDCRDTRAIGLPR